jgi:hypothetical protein
MEWTFPHTKRLHSDGAWFGAARLPAREAFVLDLQKST